MLKRILVVIAMLVPGLSFGTGHERQITDISVAASELSRIAGHKVRLFSTRDFGRERYEKGRSVVVSEAESERILSQIRPHLGPGLIAYIGASHSYAEGSPQGTEVVVAPGADQFDILRVAATDAVNYDKTTEDLIVQLKKWDRAYGIEVFRAETDVVEFRLKKSPSNWRAFAKELYQFCPDIVDQGAGTVAALEAEVRRSGRAYLWWD